MIEGVFPFFIRNAFSDIKRPKTQNAKKLRWQCRNCPKGPLDDIFEESAFAQFKGLDVRVLCQLWNLERNVPALHEDLIEMEVWGLVENGKLPKTDIQTEILICS